MSDMETTKKEKSMGPAFLKAMSTALKPTEKSLEKQKVLLTHIARNSYAAKKNAEEKLEEGKAEKVTANNEKKQTSFLEGIFGQAKKDKKASKGIFGFLMDNWKLIAVGIGLLLTPIKDLVTGFNWMKDYWETHTMEQMGMDLAKAFVLAMGLKIGAGILFKELVKSIAKAFLPVGVGVEGLTASTLASSLLPAGMVLAFIAGFGKSLWDGYKGTKLADEWGVEKIDAAIGSFIGGTGEGISNALSNSLTKGAMFAGVGFMVGGPIGAIVFGILGAAFGAITGWFGGKKISQWVERTRKSIGEAWDKSMKIMDDAMNTLKDFSRQIIDGIILSVRKVFPNFMKGSTSAELAEDAARDATGSQTPEHQKRREETLKENIKKEKGGARHYKDPKKQLEMTESDYDTLFNRTNLTGDDYATLDKLRKQKIRLMEQIKNQTKEKKKSDLSFADLKIKKNVNTAMAINPALANTVHMSGAAFKAAGHQMRVTSGFRNTAAQRKAMEELRRDDPAQYEKNYKLDPKNDASTEKWLKDHISRHSTGNAVDVSYPEGIKGNKAKQEEFVNSLNSMLQKDGDGSYAVAEGHHIHINTGQKTGKMSQATFEKAFNVKMAQRANPGVGSQLGPMPQNNGNGVTNITTINNGGDTVSGGGTTLVQPQGAGDSNAEKLNAVK